VSDPDYGHPAAMTRPPRLALLALLPVALSAQAPPTDWTATRRAMTATLDSAAARGFTGHVLAVRNGVPVFEASRGLADAARGTPVDSATIFSIGSVTKQFTRAAILKLEEQGRLSLGDSIGRFLPGLPADKRRITIAQVLDMRAGFHEYHDTPRDTVPADHQRVGKAEAIRRIAAQRLLFAPGTRRAYSNSGYTLLAAIVEAAGGTSYERYVRTTFLEPLGMASTGFYGEDRWADARMARGRGQVAHGAVNAPHRWPRVSWVLMGAGGMVSNARDLWRFVEGVRAGRVLGPAAVARLYPRDPAVYAGGNDFGFGMVVLEFDGGRDVVLANTNAGDGRIAVGARVAEVMRGAPLPAEVRATFGLDRGSAEGAGAGAGATDRPGAVRPLPDTPQARTVRAFLAALRDGTPPAIERAVRELFTDQMRGVAPMDRHVAILGDVARTMREASVVTVAPAGEHAFELRVGGDMVVRMRVQAEAPYRLARVDVQ
jgi:CubicO group peptidase (beta-lactamase class C family)